MVLSNFGIGSTEEMLEAMTGMVCAVVNRKCIKLFQHHQADNSFHLGVPDKTKTLKKLKSIRL